MIRRELVGMIGGAYRPAVRAPRNAAEHMSVIGSDEEVMRHTVRYSGMQPRDPFAIELYAGEYESELEVKLHTVATMSLSLYFGGIPGEMRNLESGPRTVMRREKNECRGLLHA